MQRVELLPRAQRPEEQILAPQSHSAQEAERLVGSGGCEADAQMSYLSY